jgi:uncharacterized protein YuzE
LTGSIRRGAGERESDDDKPGVILDYDRDGNVVGIEILDASKRVENPQSIEYVAGAAQRQTPACQWLSARWKGWASWRQRLGAARRLECHTDRMTSSAPFAR